MFQLAKIGTVYNDAAPQDYKYPFYTPSRIEVEAKYIPDLQGLDKTSHIWVICLFNMGKDENAPPAQKKDPEIEQYGALAIRSQNHPNPLALSLTRLLKVEGANIFVENLDAFDGTPVLDIKPYYERDIIFSPDLPTIRHRTPPHRFKHLLQLAQNHHRELCAGAALAVQMSSLVEVKFAINIADERVVLAVQGDPCFADALQGLTRSRIAHPARFSYQKADSTGCIWSWPEGGAAILLKPPVLGLPPEHILTMSPDELFQTVVLSREL